MYDPGLLRPYAAFPVPPAHRRFSAPRPHLGGLAAPRLSHYVRIIIPQKSEFCVLIVILQPFLEIIQVGVINDEVLGAPGRGKRFPQELDFDVRKRHPVQERHALARGPNGGDVLGKAGCQNSGHIGHGEGIIAHAPVLSTPF